MDTLFFVIEILGTVAFAAAGAMVAIDKETDLFGVVFLAIITCFGGGITRDLLIGNILPLAFSSYLLLTVAAVTAIIVYIFAAIFKKKYVENKKLISRINNYFDAAGLGLFAVMGTRICMESGYTHPLVAISMGMITCIFGGMIRDFSLREIPFVLRKRIYAIAAIAGSGVYYVLFTLGLIEWASILIGAITVFVIRILATVFKWNMPKAIVFSEIEKKDTK